jgi:hypothetical protein
MCADVLEGNRWGGDAQPKCLEYLGRYGVHAKEILPRLEGTRKRGVKLESIETATESPPVVDLKEFMERAAKK